MCLAQFATNYMYSKGNRNSVGGDDNEFVEKLDGNVPDDTDDMPDTNVIKLQNGLGQMKKIKRKAVIQWHNFNIEKKPEKHFRSHIMLFLPWRIERSYKAIICHMKTDILMKLSELRQPKKCSSTKKMR